jgi:putrescine transport system substrate-binding protein
MRKKIIALIAATAALSGAFLGPAVGAERVVNVFNWSDYVDAKTLDDFTRETGV